MKMRIMFCAVMTIFLFPTSEAQILKGILKETKRKAQREVENMVIEKASEMIAREIAKSLEKSIDNMFQEMQDSIRRNSEDTLDYDGALRTYYAYLNSLNETVDLPDEYTFDLTLVTETSGHNEARPAKMHFSGSESIFAIEQEESSKTNSLIIMDLERDAMILYNEEKGKKTAQVIPSLTFFTHTTKYSGYEDVIINKTGGKKTIAGYECQEFSGESEQFDFTYYSTDKLGVQWSNNYGKLVQQVAPSVYDEQVKQMNGMVLESITVEKGKKKPTEMIWTTTEVLKRKLVIKNSDYTFGQAGQ